MSTYAFGFSTTVRIYTIAAAIITRDMTISEAIKRFPSTVGAFVQYGLHCVGCEAAPLETISEAAQTHGIKDIDKLLQDLNAAAQF